MAAGLLTDKSLAIVHHKGVLSVAEEDAKYHVQPRGVYALSNGRWAENEWADDEDRESILVLVGVDLPRDRLQEGFAETLAKPGMMRMPTQALVCLVGQQGAVDFSRLFDALYELLRRFSSRHPGRDRAIADFKEGDGPALVRRRATTGLRVMQTKLDELDPHRAGGMMALKAKQITEALGKLAEESDMTTAIAAAADAARSQQGGAMDGCACCGIFIR